MKTNFRLLNSSMLKQSFCCKKNFWLFLILVIFFASFNFVSSAYAIDRYSNSQRSQYSRDEHSEDNYKNSKISRYEEATPFKKADTPSYSNRYSKSKKSTKYSLRDSKGESKYEFKEKTRYNYDDEYDSNDNYDNEYSDEAINHYKRKGKKYPGYYKVGKPYKIFGRWYHPKEDWGYKEVGVSSWYGEDFYGKLTANGETYDMYDMTAAHRTLPMPCIVKVTNLKNGKSVKLRVNDRGPFAKERIIDVSKAASKKLGFHRQGTTKVKVEFLKKDTKKLWRELDIKR